MVSHLKTYRRTLGTATLVGILTAIAWLVLPAPARADTVYLKNGRAIRASHVEVLEDEGRVILHQGANRVVIPLSIVDRIVEDGVGVEMPEPGTAEPAREPTPTEPEEGETAPAPEGEDDAQSEEGEGGADAVESALQTTRAYWQDAMLAIEEERTLLQDSLAELRREERAFLFSHRSTAETKAKIEAVQMRLAELDEVAEELRREARRLGVPPGWLRLDPRPRGTDR